jgi:hypothetical protein
MEVLFARYCANDGGPFRQVLRWVRQVLRGERSLPCRFIWFNEGECFWFPALRTLEPVLSAGNEGEAFGSPPLGL